MFVFQKIWCALFSCNAGFEICPFALTPTNTRNTVFLVCINDVCSNLSTNVKFSAVDTPPFPVVNDTDEIFKNLSNDLCIISDLSMENVYYPR